MQRPRGRGGARGVCDGYEARRSSFVVVHNLFAHYFFRTRRRFRWPRSRALARDGGMGAAPEDGSAGSESPAAAFHRAAALALSDARAPGDVVETLALVRGVALRERAPEKPSSTPGRGALAALAASATLADASRSWDGFEPVGEEMLHGVAPEWLPCLTSSQRASLFDDVLRAGLGADDRDARPPPRALPRPNRGGTRPRTQAPPRDRVGGGRAVRPRARARPRARPRRRVRDRLDVAVLAIRRGGRARSPRRAALRGGSVRAAPGRASRRARRAPPGRVRARAREPVRGRGRGIPRLESGVFRETRRRRRPERRSLRRPRGARLAAFALGRICRRGNARRAADALVSRVLDADGGEKRRAAAVARPPPAARRPDRSNPPSRSATSWISSRTRRRRRLCAGRFPSRRTRAAPPGSRSSGACGFSSRSDSGGARRRGGRSRTRACSAARRRAGCSPRS